MRSGPVVVILAPQDEVAAERKITMKLTHAAFAAVLLASKALAENGDPLAEQRARWSAAQVHDYEYTYQRYCECYKEAPPLTTVTVVDGAVRGVRHRYPGAADEVQAEARNLQWYRTIDDLFALIESARERGAVVRARYDEQLGYPVQVFVDFDPAQVGEEIDVRVSRLTPRANAQ